MKELGDYLQDTRRSNGVSLEEAANDLNVDVSYLENIESANVRAFKDVYYLKTLVKSYAKYLGLDEVKIQDEFNLSFRMKFESLEAFDLDDFSEDYVKEMIERALAVLPDRCREIFVLSKIEGKKQKEIAEELNVSVKTIESQITIAYKKLREELKNSFPLLLFLLPF